MEAFVEWITRIVLFLILAIVADALLPSGVMKKYARLVMSILLLLIFLGPLFRLLNVDPEVLMRETNAALDEQVDGEMLDEEIESKKKEILEGQDAYKLEQVTQALSAELEQPLEENYQMTLADVEMSFYQEPYGMETLDKLTLTLSSEKEREAVEEVDISIKEEKQTEARGNDEEIQQWVAEQLDLDKEQIDIRWEEENG
ncbi:stage III sporulation protein AF [Halobacillus sp. ACCC02827]|uniref:stage III sporulation protein AF n=1 Tax=Bacillaceae TaxID=186817 RepID=UPI0002A4D597|nr:MULTISPECIES: stage III sporulation protein AF [Bacillaceae]ELK46257.1 stage III sporulation protein AF [Halobacillus sp. BAB-2008]QHT47126.1 stage III sporulation protein AF [Bacillus sp. SB49]WJE14353.1 stage III sporulation protein AF [Halobacillus sp. ACCC02827]